MGTVINKADMFGPYRLIKIRDVLRAFSISWYDDIGTSKLKNIDLPVCAVTAIRSELAHRGFFLEEGERRSKGLCSSLGRGMLNADAKGKVPIAQARKVLNDFLKRCVENNQSPLRHHDVSKVWLFGSVMRGAAEVGDIDIVVELESADTEFSREFLEWTFDRQVDYASEFLAESVFNGMLCGPSLADKLTKKRVYGKRRHRLLSSLSERDLIALHVPCQLVFSLEEGGIFAGPVLDHHPESKGRSGNMAEPLTMPDLPMFNTPAPINFEGLGFYRVPESEIHRGMDSASGNIFTTTQGVECTYGYKDLRSNPKYQKLVRKERWGDLVMAPKDDAEKITVAHIDQEWSIKNGIAVSTISVDVVGSNPLSDWLRAGLSGYLIFLVGVSVHLAKSFSTATSVEVVLKAKRRGADRALHEALSAVSANPAWALDGGERIRLTQPRRHDVSMVAGLIVAIETSSGQSTSVDIGSALQPS